MQVCALALASLLSLTANVQNSQPNAVSEQPCLTSSPGDGRCYTRPAKLIGEYDLRANLKRFDANYDDAFQPKTDHYKTAPSVDERNRRIKSVAAAAALTNEQRRHLLKRYSQIKLSLVAYDPAGSRALTTDSGDQAFEIPVLARISVVPSGQKKPLRVQLRGRLVLPPDFDDRINANQFQHQEEMNAQVAKVIEIDAQTGDRIDQDDLRNLIGPAALIQMYLELIL